MTAPVASGWSGLPGGPFAHWKAPPYHDAGRERTVTKSHKKVAFLQDSWIEYVVAVISSIQPIAEATNINERY